MTRDTWSGEARALFKVLRELVEDRFSELSGETVEEVFSAALEGRETSVTSDADGEDSSSGWTSRIDNEVVRPLYPDTATVSEVVGATSSVAISAKMPGDDQGILYQILEVGAILVDLDPQPALNAVVETRLEFPEAHLTVEVQGRVVHNSERGTAIDVSGLDREDRVALKAVREDLVDEKRVVEVEEASEESSAPEGHGEVSAADSILEPGVVPPVHEEEDRARSFAPFEASRSSKSRRALQSTARRQVDLPDPDMNVATSTRRLEKQKGKSTREFYGPPPPWLEPTDSADRIEQLTEERILDILLQLSATGFTGLMVLGVDNTEEQLVFDGGYVVDHSMRPRVTEEELGPMLLAADRITKRQLAMAAAHADELDMTVARSLMDLGIHNPDELRHAIAGRLTFLLREVCDRAEGTVEIFESGALPAGFLPQPPLRVHVPVERVIYDRLFRRLAQYSSDSREQRMEDVFDTYPEVVEHEHDRLERAVTEQDQKRLLDQIVNGKSRLREVMTESALGPSETFALIFSLHRMGLVRFDRSLHRTVVRERLRENITVKHLSVHKASYFEVLNVHWSSYSEVVEKAYENLTQQFDPESMPDDLDDESRKKVDEINERMEAAYAALANRKTRHAYRTRIMPEYKLEHAIPLFLKQCELAERRNNWANARDAIRRVLEIDPAHEEARRRRQRIEKRADLEASAPNGEQSSPAELTE